MFNMTLPLKYKLPILLVGFSLAVAIMLQVISYLELRRTSLDAAKAKFANSIEAKELAISDWFDSGEALVLMIAASPTTVDALRRMNASFTTYDPMVASPVDALQTAYIAQNPHDLPDRDLLNRAAGPQSYHADHETYHPFFRTVIERGGFYDAFLFDTDGNLVYSVEKEPDFATNFLSGPYADSQLGIAVKAALQGPDGAVQVADFRPYAPSGGIPAGFLVAPVSAADGRRVGAIGLQLSIDRLVSLSNNGVGMGETGETFILGKDGLTRTSSREPGRFDVLDPVPGDSFITAAMQGQFGVFENAELQSGVRVLAETRPVKIAGLDWVLVAERNMTEIMAPVNRYFYRMLAVISICAAAVLGLGIFIARAFTRPISRVSSAMKAVASGDLSVEVQDALRRDEVGEIAQSLDGLREKLMLAQAAEQERARLQEEQQYVVDVLSVGLQNLAAGNLQEPLTDEFGGSYEKLRRDFNRTVDKLNETISQVVETAEVIRGRSRDINMASEDLSRRTENQAATLEETAAALDELTSSVKSAAEGAREVESIVRQARREAEESGTVVQGAVSAMTEIERSSDQISQIIGVIDDIAFQTNLLALNAGVEAARAGDAGKGFAVVASEVRALAQRSSAAAKEIKSLIGTSTQQVNRGVDQVGRAGEALASIVNRVAHISTLVSDIAAGATEQSTGLAEINIGVTQLDQVTQQNAAMVEQSTAASHALNQEATDLASLVARFALRDQAQGAGDPGRQAPALPDRPALHPARTRPATAAREPRPRPAAAAAPAARGVWQDF
jgi:methyl-accepting chemotaxis protein